MFSTPTGPSFLFPLPTTLYISWHLKSGLSLTLFPPNFYLCAFSSSSKNNISRLSCVCVCVSSPFSLSSFHLFLSHSFSPVFLLLHFRLLFLRLVLFPALQRNILTLHSLPPVLSLSLYASCLSISLCSYIVMSRNNPSVSVGVSVWERVSCVCEELVRHILSSQHRNSPSK